MLAKREELQNSHNKKTKGKKISDQLLNVKEDEGIRILVAGENFGCGSSREHAVWALHDYGFRVIVSPSIGDIFKSNALKNGLLPLEVPMTFYRELLHHPDSEITVDLDKQILRREGGSSLSFAIDAFARLCLLQGTDQIGYLVQQENKIRSYEERYAP